MPRKILIGAVLAAGLTVTVTVAPAQEATAPIDPQTVDEARIREIVREEIVRLLGEGADSGLLDAAIGRGISNFVERQHAASEQARTERRQARARKARPVDSRDHILGDFDAPLTLIEYSDFECPYCKRFHPTVAQLMARNPGQIRWVYRHFPLGFHNPGAYRQAEASECAAEAGGNEAFWKYTDLIYARTRSGGDGFPLSQLRPLAEEIGLDGRAFDACMASGRMESRVDRDYQDAQAAGVTGTPAGFLLNRAGDMRFIEGALPLEELQKFVDELLP